MNLSTIAPLLLSSAPATGERPVSLAPDLHPIQPHLAIDAEGTVYAAFIGGPRGGRDVYVAVSEDGARSFSAARKAIDVGGKASGGNQRGPRVGVDGRGRVFVSAVQQIGEWEAKQRHPRGDVYLVVSEDGGETFSAPWKVNDRVGAADSRDSQSSAKEGMHWMAVAGNGDVHFAWLDHRLAPRKGQMIAYAKVVESGTKVLPNLLAYVPEETVCPCCTPSIAVDGEGNPAIAFRNKVGEDHPVYVVRSGDGGRSFARATPVHQGLAEVPG
jgi:hypothetical protein